MNVLQKARSGERGGGLEPAIAQFLRHLQIERGLSANTLSAYGMDLRKFAAFAAHRKITLVGVDRSYLPITRFSIEQSDGVTAISSYLRDRTLKEFVEYCVAVAARFHSHFE